MAPRKQQAMPTTPAALKEAAYAYLGRQAASVRRLEDNLRRKIRRLEEVKPDFDTKPLHAAIPEIVDTCRRLNLVDDAALAERRAAQFHARGLGIGPMKEKMRALGLGGEEVDAALGPYRNRDADVEAAQAYAKRRRLGPWRQKAVADTREQARKDMAALGRAGFGYEVARRALEAPDQDE